MILSSTITKMKIIPVIKIKHKSIIIKNLFKTSGISPK